MALPPLNIQFSINDVSRLPVRIALQTNFLPCAVSSCVTYFLPGFPSSVSSHCVSFSGLSVVLLPSFKHSPSLSPRLPQHGSSSKHAESPAPFGCPFRQSLHPTHCSPSPRRPDRTSEVRVLAPSGDRALLPLTPGPVCPRSAFDVSRPSVSRRFSIRIEAEQRSPTDNDPVSWPAAAPRRDHSKERRQKRRTGPASRQRGQEGRKVRRAATPASLRLALAGGVKTYGCSSMGIILKPKFGVCLKTSTKRRTE